MDYALFLLLYSISRLHCHVAMVNSKSGCIKITQVSEINKIMKKNALNRVASKHTPVACALQVSTDKSRLS